MHSHSPPILVVDNLYKHYVVRDKIVKALNGLTLEIFPGETLAVVGESGSGKTTLANLVLGIESPTQGKILFQGQVLGTRRSRKLRRQIQVVQQNPMSTLNPRRTIRQSIELPLRIHRLVPERQMRDQVAQLLQTVGISPKYMDRYPSVLSGGQRQRVAIARALAAKPSLVILDEPTSALDVSVQAKVLSLLVELQAQFNLTYLFITHDLSVVRNIASRVAVMYRGKLVEAGPTQPLYLDPKHPYTRMLLSSIPVVSAEEESLKPEWPWEQNIIDDIARTSSGCPFAPRCPFAEEPCWDVVPTLGEVEPNHLVACHLHTGVLGGGRAE